MKIGAQWFTNRNYLTTNEGIEQAFKKTKELGYDCAQYSGAPNGGDFDPTFLKEMIDKYSLPITLTHISFDKICNNLDEEIEKHKAIGCCNIGLGAMPNGAPAMQWYWSYHFLQSAESGSSFRYGSPPHPQPACELH